MNITLNSNANLKEKDKLVFIIGNSTVIVLATLIKWTHCLQKL